MRYSRGCAARKSVWLEDGETEIGDGPRRPHHDDADRVQEPLRDPPGPAGHRPVREPVEQVKGHRHGQQPDIRCDEGVVRHALPTGEERTGRAERGDQRCERHDDHEQADEAHLRIARPQQREPGAAHEKRNAHDQEQRFEQTPPDDSERQLEGHALPAALEVHAIARATADVAELCGADHSGSLVAIQRDQPIAHFHRAAGGAPGVDL